LKFGISDVAKNSAHIRFALSADNHKIVDAFYVQAMAASGIENRIPLFVLRRVYIGPRWQHFPGRMEDQFSDAELILPDWT